MRGSGLGLEWLKCGAHGGVGSGSVLGMDRKVHSNGFDSGFLSAFQLDMCFLL